MKVENKSIRTYQHSYFDDKGSLQIINCRPKEIIDVDKSIAQVWIATGDIVEYADPKEQANLIDENEKLKAEIAALKGEQQEKSLDELKKEADELGITYARNIGAKKLAERIEAAKG